MGNLYLCERPYSIYRTLVKVISEVGQHDIVISNHMMGTEKMLQPLKESGIFKKVFFFDDVEYNTFAKCGTTSDFNSFLKSFFLLPKKFYLCIRMQKRAKTLKLPEGLDIMAYDDIYEHDSASSIFLYLCHKNKTVICVEHARNTFQEGPKGILFYRFGVALSSWLERIGLCYAAPRVSKYTKEFEVSDAKNLISFVKKKRINEINLDKLIEKLSEDEKGRIFEIYKKAYSIEIPEGKKISILITQPLCIDALLPDKETQEEVYQKIIREYMSDMDIVLIKPHPRDVVDYTDFVPNSIVLDGAVSAEVLNLNSRLCIEKVVTVSSSSIHAFFKVKECILLGNEYLKTFLNEKKSC